MSELPEHLHSAAAGEVVDEVDEVIEEWAAVRPDIDRSSIGVFGRIDRIHQFRSVNRRRLMASHGLSAAAFDVLLSLRRAGEPYRRTAGELARAAQLTSGAITFRLDKMEAEGLIRRVRTREDRRVVHAELAAAGKAKIDAVFEDYIALEQSMLGGLSGEDRAQLADLLRKLAAAQRDAPLLMGDLVPPRS